MNNELVRYSNVYSTIVRLLNGSNTHHIQNPNDLKVWFRLVLFLNGQSTWTSQCTKPTIQKPNKFIGIQKGGHFGPFLNGQFRFIMALEYQTVQHPNYFSIIPNPNLFGIQAPTVEIDRFGYKTKILFYFWRKEGWMGGNQTCLRDCFVKSKIADTILFNYFNFAPHYLYKPGSRSNGFGNSKESSRVLAAVDFAGFLANIRAAPPTKYNVKIRLALFHRTL